MTDPTTITVSGGPSGVTARYDDMETCAARLCALASVLLARLDDACSVAADVDVLEGAALAPVTAARVAEHAASATVGPRGLGAAAAHLTASAVLLRGAVTAHQALDRSLAAATSAGETVAALPVLAFGGDMSVQWALALRDPRVLAGAGWWTRTGDDVVATIYDHPWTVEGLVDDARLALDAAAVTGAAASPVLSGVVAVRSAAEGGLWPPITFEDAVRDVLGIGTLGGLFAQGTGTATPLSSGFAPLDESDPRPGSVEGLLAGVADLSGVAPDSAQRAAQIRVLRVAGDDGVTRYVVAIPGTQEWSPKAGPNPVDLTNNVRLMAGTGSAQNDAIVSAMHQAGIAADAPVLLVGHSQGGITAASLASDPAVRRQFAITTIVTAGAPIARFDIPADVHVLALEHTRDVVPRLDSAPNPDRPTWVTVQRDVDGLGVVDGTVDSVPASHACDLYRDTASLVDRSRDPSVVALRRAIEPFLSGEADRVRAWDFAVTRHLP